MAKIDVSDVKKRIIEFLDKNGPSIPIPIARHVNLQPMFASAILSELLHEKKIKTSFMKIGTSPLYLIPGQEHKLESMTDNLSGVEKEAYIILKDNKLIEDSAQEPRIRVALRSLKDFAIQTQINGKLFWKYFTLSDAKLKENMKDEGDVLIGEQIVGQQIWNDIKKEPSVNTESIEIQKNIKEEIVSILSKESENRQLDSPITTETKTESAPIKIQKIRPRKLTEKDIFLEHAKEVLKSKNIEIIEIIQFDKKQVVAKVRAEVDKTCILYFLDKKRPDEKDIMRAFKKSKEHGLPYYIFTHSEPSKKLIETKNMYKALVGFGSTE